MTRRKLVGGVSVLLGQPLHRALRGLGGLATLACSRASAARCSIMALVTEDPDTFRALKAPVRRVCAAPVPVPFSPPLEQAALPDQTRIKAAIRQVLDGARP